MNKSETWVIETRKEAIAAHRSKYWTGRRCARNHESRRYTATGACCQCSSENSMAYQKRILNELKGIDDPMIRASIEIHRDQEQALREYAEVLNKITEPEDTPAAVITLPPHLGGGDI